MKNFIKYGVMAVAGVLCLLPGTLSASPLLQFTFSSSGATSTVTNIGGTNYLTALTETVTAITISGAITGNGTYTGLSDTLNISTTSTTSVQPDTFILYGALTGLGPNSVTGTSGTPWLSFTTAASSATSSGSNWIVTYGAPTSIVSVNSNLLTDLTATAFSAATLGTGNGALVPNAGGVTSNTLAVTLTPEPASFLMLGSGLIALGLAGRKKMFRPSGSR